MLKKITVWLLTISLFVISICSVFAQENEVIDIGEQDAQLTNEKIDTVFGLGIIELNSEDNMFLAGTVSRMDFAQWLYRMLNYSNRDIEIEPYMQYFEDISLNHYGAGYIQELVRMGVVSGYGDNNFRAEQEITFNEAAIMLVAAASQKDFVKDSYYAYAHNIGLFDGVYGGKDAAMTRRDAAMLLYNLMFTKVPELKIQTELEYDVSNGAEFVYKVMGLRYVDGTVDAIGGVSLYDISVADNNVSIDKVIYRTNEIFDDTYLGYNARIYLVPEDSEIIYICPLKNDVMEFRAEELNRLEYQNYTYEYEKDDIRKKARIERDYDFVYNNYYCQDVTKMKPAYGTVKLIDNDKNGRYDVVIVTEMHSYIVDSIIGNDEIVFKNFNTDGTRKIIQLKDYDDVKLYNSTGASIKLSAIRQGCALTVMEGENDVIEIYMSDEKTGGFIQTVSTDDGITSVVIDGVVYELVNGYYAGTWMGNVNINITLMFDIYHNACGIEIISSDRWQYGYIIVNKAKDIYGNDVYKGIRKDMASEKAYMRLLTQNGEIKRIYLRDKCVINNVSIKGPDAQCTAVENAYNSFNTELSGLHERCKEQVTTFLMKYKLNDEGDISVIDTPIKQQLSDVSNNGNHNNSFMIRAKGRLYYTPYQKQIKANIKDWIEVSGEVFVDGNTKFFVIPEGDLETAEDKDYAVTNLQGVGFNPAGQDVDISGYNSNPDSIVCDVVVVRKNSGVSTNSSLMIFDKSYELVDDDNELRTKVVGFAGGNMKEYFLSSDSPKQPQGNLFEGDVILYSISDDEIKIEEIMYTSANNAGVLNNAYNYTITPSNNYTDYYFNADFRVVKGIPKRISDGYVYIDFNTAQSQILDEVLKLDSVNMFDINSDEKFYNASVASLKTEAAFPGNPDKLFVCTKNAQIVSVVAIRD